MSNVKAWTHVRGGPRHGRQIVVVLALCIGVVLAGLPAAGVAGADNSVFFDATGHTVGGPFLNRWQTQGGLSIFGYPISDEQDQTDAGTGKTVRVQWFERARFELHPEFAGTSNEVELGLLGRQFTRGRESEPPFQPIRSGAMHGRTSFAQTGHTLGSRFGSFWTAHGGLPSFGYPISEEFQELNPSDGQMYTVQYFERARFEYHPTNPTAYQVELGLLGDQLASPGSLRSAVVIQIGTGATPIRIAENETALVPPGSVDLSISLLYPGPVDGPFDVKLTQIATAAPWQLAPDARNTRTRNAYNLRLRGGAGSPSYVGVEVIAGTHNPATFFGIQVDGGRTDAPPLIANWNDPVKLVASFYNAINRKEYARAYSYWNSPGAPNGVTANFADFVAGYAGTTAVAIATGDVTTGAAAGSVYMQVPTVLATTLANGATQRFYGCYLLRQANVEIGDTTPPYPIALLAARIIAAKATDDPKDLLARATAVVQTGQCTQ